MGAVERAIRFPAYGIGAHRQALELALTRGRLIRSILLELQLGLNADLFEIAQHQLRRIDQVTAIATTDRELRLKTLGMPGFCQQPSGLLGIILIVLRPRAELVDG